MGIFFEFFSIYIYIWHFRLNAKNVEKKQFKNANGKVYLVLYEKNFVFMIQLKWENIKKTLHCKNKKKLI